MFLTTPVTVYTNFLISQDCTAVSIDTRTVLSRFIGWFFAGTGMDSPGIPVTIPTGNRVKSRRWGKKNLNWKSREKHFSWGDRHFLPAVGFILQMTADSHARPSTRGRSWNNTESSVADRAKETRSNFYRFQSSTEFVLLTGFLEVVGIKCFHLKRFMASLCFRFPKFQASPSVEFFYT